MLSVSREASGTQPGPGKNSAWRHQRGCEVAGGGGRVLRIHVHLLRVISTPPCPSCHVTCSLEGLGSFPTSWLERCVCREGPSHLHPGMGEADSRSRVESRSFHLLQLALADHVLTAIGAHVLTPCTAG